MESKEGLLRRRSEVEASIGQLIGWGDAAVSGSPRYFLERAKRMLLAQENAEGEGGASRRDSLMGGEEGAGLELNWNLAVSGASGAGLSTFCAVAQRLHKVVDRMVEERVGLQLAVREAPPRLRPTGRVRGPAQRVRCGGGRPHERRIEQRCVEHVREQRRRGRAGRGLRA